MTIQLSQIFNSNHIDRNYPLPLYQQLSDILVDAIHKGKLKPGDQLPSENELITFFGISRYVVRQTLNLLSHQGLIVTYRGKGSYVTLPKIEKAIDILQSYHASMKKAGVEVDVQIIAKKITRAPREIAEKLGLELNSKVFKLERLAYLNKVPINILISYIVIGRASDEQLLAFSGGSLYAYLAQTCNIHLAISHNVIEIAYAGTYESNLLNIKRGSSLLIISGVSCEQDNNPIEYSKVIYPAQKFRFEFDSRLVNQTGEIKKILTV